MLEQTIALLSHAEPDVRYEAAQTLGRSNDRRAVAPLAQTLADENAKVQYAALSGLVRLKDAAAAGPILDLLLGDPDNRLWELLKLSVGLRLRTGILDMMTPGDTALADRLTGALAGEALDEPQQAFVVRLLGRTQDVRAVDMLIDRLMHDTATVQTAAAEALGYIGDARAVGPLLLFLGEDSGALREVAAEALGRLGDARAVEPLMAALADGDEWVRRAACAALGRLGDPRAVAPLAEALRDEAVMVQDAAFEAIKQLSDASYNVIL